LISHTVTMHSSGAFACVMRSPIYHILIIIQEFISTCEALELVPENELELSRQGRPETAANRREQKVRLLPPYNF
jgi:hypothetical protein